VDYAPAPAMKEPSGWSTVERNCSGTITAEKLTAILSKNEIKSLTVIRMEVPCCGGIVHAAVEVLRNSGKMIPWNVVTLATDGSVLEE